MALSRGQIEVKSDLGHSTPQDYERNKPLTFVMYLPSGIFTTVKIGLIHLVMIYCTIVWGYIGGKE
jgi:hypothetical protein